jgi:hypothetical protein
MSKNHGSWNRPGTCPLLTKEAEAEQLIEPRRHLRVQREHLDDAGTGGVKLVIHNYVKPDDSMTLTIDKGQKQLQSIQITSYMDGPSDSMNLTGTGLSV